MAGIQSGKAGQFWQMYTHSIKSECVLQPTFPLRPSFPFVHAYPLLEPGAFSAAEPTWLPGIKEKAGMSNCAVSKWVPLSGNPTPPCLTLQPFSGADPRGSRQPLAFPKTGCRKLRPHLRAGPEKVRTLHADAGSWFVEGKLTNPVLSGMPDEKEHSNTTDVEA